MFADPSHPLSTKFTICCIHLATDTFSQDAGLNGCKSSLIPVANSLLNDFIQYDLFVFIVEFYFLVIVA